MDLLQEIAHCPIVEYCKAHPDSGHPCAAIVAVQDSVPLADHQAPEPWSGHLEEAPILFLGSNPSITYEEENPVGSWSNLHIADFFSNQFSGGREEWIRDGRYSRSKDGIHFKYVPFWSGVRERAAELMEVDVNDLLSGIDYCISQAVHCKSRDQIGVAAAFEPCVGRYLERLVAQSGAKVIVCLGVHAARAAKQTFNVPTVEKIFGPVEVGQRERMFTFLPHPAARSLPKSFAKNLLEDELGRLRAFLRHDGSE
ncbi:MAG: uracil-DNA glycosylase family protein [Thermomicrobiales bacterium]